MSTTHDFDIHIDADCVSPAMEEPTQIHPTGLPLMDEAAQPESDHTASTDHAEAELGADDDSLQVRDAQDDATATTDLGTPHASDTESKHTPVRKPTSLACRADSLDDCLPDGHAGDGATMADEQPAELDHTTDTDTCDDAVSSLLEAGDLSRSHSVRTEALIQAAARAVLSMRQARAQEHIHQDANGSVSSALSSEDEDRDETVHADQDDAFASRPASSASHTLLSPTAQSSAGESDVFSDRSPRSSVLSSSEHYDDDVMERTTEKGQQSPYARSRVTSRVSASSHSVMSDLSCLSGYDQDDFVPIARRNRSFFRSPSSVRALQLSSPTPSSIKSPNRSGKRQTDFPTVSRVASSSMSDRFSPKGRSTPSRFKKQEAPLVLLHVTLLPLRWSYGDMMNHFEATKLAPLAFSSEGIKNLRAAWRQLQDRLGDTVLERGILLPHPQNDYKVLEERMLESLELPLRRRARILECGHYLGPSNKITIGDDVEPDSDDNSDLEELDADLKGDKKHWCKTCRGNIKYEELGNERVFRIKVYASNGLMSAGAWDACWKEMERVDIEVEPIIDASIQTDLAKLSAALDHEHQQMLEAEQKQQEEEEQRYQLEAEQRMSIAEERQQLEAQRQQFEQERLQSLEQSQRQLEEERRRLEEEQRRRLEEERRQQFEEERQLLDAQRQQFEEQRVELEAQRQSVEEEQRQHLEEARRQELELEQKLIEEQRQELEATRQQFEEERRQRLEEEEELRRLQRDEDDLKQAPASRSISRNSYVEEELPSPATERPTSTELQPRRRDADRLREIYGARSRASSDGVANSSSPAIHIHVDSHRQREEEQSSRQLAISAPQDCNAVPEAAQQPIHQDSYNAVPREPSPTQQAYQRQEAPRKSLDSASLPELLGESIRVLLQDPKNIAIAVLVVFIAILTGQFATRQERGIELYKSQQPQYQRHQLDSPVGQVIMNTPARVETVYQTVTEPAPQQVPASKEVEIVYQTVTVEPAPQQVPVSKEVEIIYRTVTVEPAPQQVPVSKEVEIIYQTVTQYANQASQETATRVVEPVYSTVPAPAVEARGQAVAPGVASKLKPSSAGPPPDLPLDYLENEAESSTAILPSFTALGLDPFVCLVSAASKPESDEPTFKSPNSNESEGDAQNLSTSPPSHSYASNGDVAIRSASNIVAQSHGMETPPTCAIPLGFYNHKHHRSNKDVHVE